MMRSHLHFLGSKKRRQAFNGLGQFCKNKSIQSHHDRGVSNCLKHFIAAKKSKNFVYLTTIFKPNVFSSY